MKTIEGYLKGDGKKVAIIASRFNTFVVDRLIEGAVDGLVRHGVTDSDITLYRIPGSFEFPAFLANLLQSKATTLDGILCLGAIIRGETPHFDFVANEAIKGIAQLSMNSSCPVMMGILTTETLEQAVHRAGAKSGNKGFECALGLVEMMDLYQKIG